MKDNYQQNFIEPSNGSHRELTFLPFNGSILFVGDCMKKIRTKQVKSLIWQYMNGLGFRVMQDINGTPYKGIDILFLWRASYQLLGWSKTEAEIKRHFITPVMMEWFKCKVCDKESFMECKAKAEQLYAHQCVELSEGLRRQNACDVSRLDEKCTDAFFTQEFYKSRKWQKLRYAALMRYGNRCMCCGRGVYEGVVLHVDHIKPKSIWPELAYNINNLQILCEDCNLGKGNRDRMNWKALQDRQSQRKVV